MHIMPAPNGLYLSAPTIWIHLAHLRALTSFGGKKPGRPLEITGDGSGMTASGERDGLGADTVYVRSE